MDWVRREVLDEPMMDLYDGTLRVDFVFRFDTGEWSFVRSDGSNGERETFDTMEEAMAMCLVNHRMGDRDALGS